jgi:hypothetical protein
MKRLFLLLAPLGLLFAAALAQAAPAQQFAPGAVVGLVGTTHVWVADEAGVLHWGGDTRALAGKAINWSQRLDLSLDQIRALRRGDPWLSAGLLKMGDPIYLVKWESDWPTPILLHIQSIADVELFGINGVNYSAMVLDQAAWEQQYRLAARSLTIGVLQPAANPTPTQTPAPTATPGPTATPTPPAYGARIVSQSRLGPCSYETVVEVSGLKAGQRMSVSGTHGVYNCAGTGPNKSVVTATGFPPQDAGVADGNGLLRWRLEHSPFSVARYVFTDEAGFSVTVEQGSD